MDPNSNSLYNLQVWGQVCAGEHGRLSIPGDATVSSVLFWSGYDVPLCSQLVLLSIMHIPLLLSSAFYMGMYSPWARFHQKSRILQLLTILSCLFFLVSLTNFSYFFFYTRSTHSYILITFLLIKLLTWNLTTICILQLVFSRGYNIDRTPAYSTRFWLLVLLSTLFYYRSLLTYQIHPDWYSVIDTTFLEGNFFLYTISLELFLHILYGALIILSYFKVRILFYIQRRRRTDPLSRRLLNIQDSYGSIHGQEHKINDRPVNEEGASLFSYLFFGWFNQTIYRGYKRKITSLDDLPSLPKSLKGNRLITNFNGYYSDKLLYGKKLNKWHLLLSVVRVAGFKFYFAGFLKLTADAVTFTGPLLINGLVYLVENNNQPIYIGYLYVIGLFAASITGMLLNVHFQYLVDKVNISISSALMNAVYQKVTRLNQAKLSSFSTGQVLDFMSTDADRLASVWNIHLFWSMPAMIMICLYLLYLQVGLSFLAGLSFCVGVIAINQVLTVLIAKVFKKYMNCKDERIKLMSEILTGARVIKLYAWEKLFKNKVDKIRAAELTQLAWVKCLDGFCVFFWACTATMMCVLTFITYSLMGHELTAARVVYTQFIIVCFLQVFTSVALFAILIGPLNGFPLVLQWLAEAWVSLERLNNFLSAKECYKEDYYTNQIPEDPDVVISVQGGRFSWDHKKQEITDYPEYPLERPFLTNINIVIHSGQFVGIVGKVGSGKSSILSALTMELNKRVGNVYYKYLDNGFGIVSQESWIQYGTIRSNILFGLPYNEALYEEVVNACALKPDFVLAHNGDLTEVGENGINLSGGQKARINLARACYQQKPCILLDDPLSAVDANVAQHILANCLNKLLADKTRILITHRVELLKTVDVVYEVDDGEIVNIDSPNKVLPSVHRRYRGHVDGMNYIDNGIGDDVLGGICGEEAALVKEEEKCTGSVKFKIYKSYWNSIGNIFAFLILLTMLLMESSKRITDVWLSIWTTTNTTTSMGLNKTTNTTQSSDVYYYLGIYAGLSIATCIVTVFRAATFAIGTFKASKLIHAKVYQQISKATILFFDCTPIGRILNRFSSDLYITDFDLPFNLNIFLAQIFSLIGALVITIYGLPLILILLVFLSLFYFLLQHFYRRTSRELKRIASVSMSPVYSHFTETFNGIATIKGMRATDRFFSSNIEKIDNNKQANFTSNIASAWFRIRIQSISVSVVTGVGLFAVLQHQFLFPVNPGLLGLALSYAITLTSILGSTVETFTQLEMLMVAIERIDEYTNDTPVEDLLGVSRSCHNYIGSRTIYWGHQSPSITFENVSLVYRQGLQPALKRVSFRVGSGEKLGVAGRTGAGKSSLVRALFRLFDICDGKILLDGANIFEYSLHDLRMNLAAIPQEPFLFSGTVRENLFPDVARYHEEEYWSCLYHTFLKPVVVKMGGLDAQVGVGGKNFSVGQKQLLCLARAMLTGPKVLCIDEATANIDSETDKQIQHVIRTKFRHTTVITIAHRINTILDSDKILVMENGVAVEFGTPKSLLDNTNSTFYALATQSI